MKVFFLLNKKRRKGERERDTSPLSLSLSLPKFETLNKRHTQKETERGLSSFFLSKRFDDEKKEDEKEVF